MKSQLSQLYWHGRHVLYTVWRWATLPKLTWAVHNTWSRWAQAACHRNLGCQVSMDMCEGCGHQVASLNDKQMANFLPVLNTMKNILMVPFTCTLTVTERYTSILIQMPSRCTWDHSPSYTYTFKPFKRNWTTFYNQMSSNHNKKVMYTFLLHHTKRWQCSVDQQQVTSLQSDQANAIHFVHYNNHGQNKHNAISWPLSKLSSSCYSVQTYMCSHQQHNFNLQWYQDSKCW